MKKKINFNSVFWFLNKRGLLNKIPDEAFLKLKYKVILGEKLNIKQPKSFNEKLHWLKLNYRKPNYTLMVDKYEVRQEIEKLIGEEYLIPLIGVWNHPNEIEWEALPQNFVLKCTHDSGGVIICKDKNSLDKSAVMKKLHKLLNTNYYFPSREWPYKYVTPRIIAEELMIDESGYELKDYKIFCFNGQPKFLQVDFDRLTNHQRNLYDLGWNLLDLEFNFPKNKDKLIKKPANFEKMLYLAEVISRNYPFIRVDFYSINEKIYFGEVTFYPEGGFGKFNPESINLELGNLLKLPLNSPELNEGVE